MDINKRSRSELKSYTSANSLLTEETFAAIIDAAINQKEDGITKPSGEPLSIEAAGDEESPKKALNLYESFADDAPSWSLSLRPRRDPADPSTAANGLSVDDSGGVSRLFIDKETGDIGAGTLTPAARLHVAENARVDGALSLASVRSTTDKLRIVGDLEVKGFVEWSGSVGPRLTKWTQVPGAARDIAVGGNGSVWIISDTPTSGGYVCMKRCGDGWSTTNGGGLRVGADATGRGWMANDGHLLYVSNGYGWKHVPAGCYDAGAGADGVNWHISTGVSPNGRYVYRGVVPGIWTFVPSNGAERITVSPNGTCWFVDNKFSIYRRDGDAWTQVPGAARDIGVGTDNNVWIIGTTPAPGGYTIHRWTGNDWLLVDGGGTNISVGPDNVPWITDSQFRIFKRTP